MADLLPFPVFEGAEERERIAKMIAAVDVSGGPPHDGGMDKRVEKLEEFAQDAKDRLIKIETRLDQTVTKADLSDAMNAQIKWMVGTAVVLGVAAITVMTFVLNNAVPKPPTAQPLQPVPIVIYAQPATTSAPPLAAPQPSPK